MKWLDMFICVLGLLFFFAFFVAAHCYFWTGRDGSAIFCLLDSIIFISFTLRLANKRGWDNV